MIQTQATIPSLTSGNALSSGSLIHSSIVNSSSSSSSSKNGVSQQTATPVQSRHSIMNFNLINPLAIVTCL